MQSSLKKSLYLGLAAVSFVAAAGATTANASAAAKVTSTPALTAAASDRNVAFTGTNAMYTKPGTVKGAKVVASTTTLNKIKDSKYGQDNVRVYAQAVTDRGSVYYKVVTYDKAYRGWIYGGKVQQQFNGGIKAYNTTTDTTASLTTAETTPYYTITKPGTANDGTATTYVAPAWTQYKLGRTVTDGTKIGNDLLKITNQATRTREGDTWVKVTDVTNSQYSGWILKSALTVTKAVPASEGVTVNYVDQATAKTVGSYVVPFTAANPTEINQYMNVATGDALNLVKNSIPAGYESTDARTQSSFGSADAAKATKGSTVTYYVKDAPKVNAGLVSYIKGANGVTTPFSLTNDVKTPASSATLYNQAKASLNGATGLTVSGADVKAAVEKAGLGTVTLNDGKTYVLESASAAVYGKADSALIYVAK